MRIFGTDYDGVIINIEQQKAKAFGEILNKYWQINIKEAQRIWLEKGGTSRRYKFEYLHNKAYGSQLEEKIYKKIEQEYSQALKTKYYPSVKILTGARGLLQFARTHFDFTFVSSGVPMEEINYLVEINGISNYFDSILGTNQQYSSKLEHFKKIVKEKNPSELVFIADSPEDMRVAKKFPGTKAVGVLTNHSAKDLKNAGADFIASNLNNVLDILKT